MNDITNCVGLRNDVELSKNTFTKVKYLFQDISR